MTNLAPVTEACECTLKQVSGGLRPGLSGPEIEKELQSLSPLSQDYPRPVRPGQPCSCGCARLAAVALLGYITSELLYSERGCEECLAACLPSGPD